MKRFLRNINLLNILLIVDTLILINYTMVSLVHTGVRFAKPMRKKPPVHQDKKAAGSTVPIIYGYLDRMYNYS